MIRIKNVEIGGSRTVIALALMVQSLKEVKVKKEELSKAPFEILEFRLDYFYKTNKNKAELQGMLDFLGQAFPDKVLLFTFRTEQEGGFCPITDQAYVDLVLAGLGHEAVDMVDLEFDLADQIKQKIMDAAESLGKYIILSHHNFQRTPDLQSMKEKLLDMAHSGGHIAKLAVMPQTKVDVQNLLWATKEAKAEKMDHIFVTMSMGDLGKITRITGLLFESAISFVSLGENSAPGQMNVYQLRKILDAIEGK